MKKLRKLRREGLNLLACLMAAAAVLGIILAADSLESRTAGRIDLSFNGITTQSETTRQVLAALDKDVHAYAVASRGNELTDLEALLDRYQAASTHFTWSREDLASNPQLLRMVSADSGDSAVTSDCLILYCPQTDRTRVLTWDDYVGLGYNAQTDAFEMTGLTYEKAITGALAYVSEDHLTEVMILEGHGEMTDQETQVLESRLQDANYLPRRINLRAGDVPDPGSILMILSPTMDLTEEEALTLADFARAGGSLFVTTDYTDPDDLPNLYAFYRLYGVTPLPGLVLADSGDASSYYGSTVTLTPKLLNVENLTTPLVEAGADFLILAPARALELSEASERDLMLYPVLQSGDTSYRRLSNDTLDDLEKREGDPEGPFVLAVLADRGFETGQRSLAFFAGGSSMFLNETVYSMTYSQELLQRVMRRLDGSDDTADIAPKQAVRPPLKAAGLLPSLLAALPPLLVALMAAAILLPRKYR